jgi:hypothetical protein
MEILISHESPLCLLQESLNYNHYQYILPYFYQRYPKYKEFMDNYKGMKILDNGLFEGEVPTIQELINLIKETNSTIFIPQDEWDDPILTLKNAKYWMNLNKSGVLSEDLNLMVVLQGKSYGEIETLYQQCVDLGYKYFAFNHSSIAYQNEVKGTLSPTTKSKVGRVEIIRRLWNRNIIKGHHWIHLLGASDITEFSYYNQVLPGIIRSIDTSNPIIKGIEEGLYTEDNMKTKSSNKMENYFDKELDTNSKDCILENIKTFKLIVNKK